MTWVHTRRGLLWQPTERVEINPSFQDEGRVGSLLTPSNGYFDLGQRRTAVNSGFTLDAFSADRGSRLGFNSNNNGLYYLEASTDADAVCHTTECTMLLVELSDAGAASNYYSNGYDDGGGRVQFTHTYANGALYWDFANSGDGRLGGIGFSNVTGRLNAWACIAGATAGRKIWHNGTLLGSNANNATRSATTAAFRWHAADGGGSGSARAYFLLSILREAWPDGKVLEWSRNPWQIFRTQARRSIYLPAAGGGAVTGDASITLDALTTSAAGKLAIAGTLSSTLGSLTSSAVGALAINGSASLTLGALTATADADLVLLGSASITLDNLTAAAEADLLIAGAAAVTLGDATLAANGTVLAAGTGSASITLGEMTASATGAVAIAGTLGVTLGDITVSAAGELSLQPGEGAASITLDALTATATGTLAIAGTAAMTLGDMTAAATGAVDIAGALGVTLGDLTVSATGAEVAPDTRTGTAQITLADLTMAAFNAPALTRLGNRRLRSSAPRLQKNDMPAGTRFRKGRLPSIY